MSRGIYNLPFTNLTLANQAVTLGFINPGTTASFKVRRCWASQAANATSAQQRIQINTQVTAFPTLTSQAPVKTAMLDGNSVITGATNGAAGTSGINASAEGGGTKTVILPDSFNVLNGHLWVPTPDEMIIMSAGGSSGFGYHFPAAPTSLTVWSGGITFEEV
jgi:hypothetical protein